MPVVSAHAWVSQWMHPVKVLWSIKVSAYRPHMAGALSSLVLKGRAKRSPGCICAPRVWRPLLLTFLLCYSVGLLGLWFCLKAPVHRREAWGGESLFLSFSSSRFIFFFFQFAICLLSLWPGISLLWLNVLKDYTLYLKTSWVNPLKFYLIRLNVKGFCVIILI